MIKQIVELNKKELEVVFGGENVFLSREAAGFYAAVYVVVNEIFVSGRGARYSEQGVTYENISIARAMICGFQFIFIKNCLSAVGRIIVYLDEEAKDWSRKN